MRRQKRRNNDIVPGDFIRESKFLKDEKISFEKGLKIFLQDCRIRNLSPHTLSFYHQKLNQIKDMLEDAKVDPTPREVNSDDIKEYIIIRFLDEGKKVGTINTLLRSFRAFFNFLHREGYLVINPADCVKLLKQKQEIVPTFNRDDLQKLFSQPDLRTFTGVRDYTIMMLLLDTGVRVRELCDITVHNINWRDNLITVDGKGMKQREVPMQSTLKRQLDKYVRLRGDDPDTDALFVTIDNTPMTIRQVQWRIKCYGEQAKIENVRVSPHTFRHTFARYAFRNGADVFTLQKILGHNTLEMVRRYVAMFSDEVSIRHRKFSPVERLWR